MATKDANYRSRITSWVRPRTFSIPFSITSEKQSERDHLTTPDRPPLNEKADHAHGEGDSSSPEPAYRPLEKSLGNQEPQEKGIRTVRTIPTWVHTLDEEDASDVTTHLLPQSPPDVQVAQHNSSPAPKQTSKGHHPPRGRLYDSQRDGEPHILSSTPAEQVASRWRAFAKASAYPPSKGETGFRASEDWLQRHGPDYSKPWLAGEIGEDGEAGAPLWRSKKRVWYKKAQNTILRNPIIPLVFRSIVWTFSLVALALAGSIHHFTDDVQGLYNMPSTDMAIIVDAVALVYILYISWDEYHGKPLGLRNAKAKMRLIFLDLFFITFDSANLSLAFEAVSDSQSLCRLPDAAHRVCKRERALASVLLIALIAWLSTFSISVLRIVEKMR